MATNIEKIPPTQYKLTPINFDYLVDGDDTIEFGEVVTPNTAQPYITNQKHRSGILDFSLNFDSINLLSKSLLKSSTYSPNSLLTYYTTPLPEVECDEVGLGSNAFNFWLTTPKEGMIKNSFDFVAKTNIIPLKTNLTTSHHVTNQLEFRKYRSFDFGSNGFDKHSLEILFHTYMDSETHSVEEFKFRLPEYSPPIVLSNEQGVGNVPDFLKSGALAGHTPIDSDIIIWEEDGVKLSTWLKQLENEKSIWTYTTKTNGSVTSTPTPLVLLSGVDYTYKRPAKADSSGIVDELINTTDVVTFILSGVDGFDILDGSPNKNHGKLIT